MLQLNQRKIRMTKSYAPEVEEVASCLVKDHFGKLLEKYGIDYFSFWGNVSFANLINQDPMTSLSNGQRIILEKFLTAQEGRVSDAVQMFLSTLSWRFENGINKNRNESTDESVAFLDKVGFTYGRDRMGNPVTYNMYGALDVDSLFSGKSDQDGLDAFIKWRVNLMEKALYLIDFENCNQDNSKVTQIHDYKGVKFLSMDKRMKIVSKQIVALFQNHYPELLSVKFFINVPAYMETMMSLFSPFVRKETRRKFRMIGPSHARASMLKVISADQLPARYGGFLRGFGVNIVGGFAKPETQMSSAPAIIFESNCLVGRRQRRTLTHEIPFTIESGKFVRVFYQILVHSHDINVQIMMQHSHDRINVLRGEYRLSSDQSSFSLLLDNSYSVLREKVVDYMLVFHVS